VPRLQLTAASLHRRLLALRDPARAAGVARFFKTGPGEYGAGDRFLGINLPTLRRLARDHRALPLRDVATLLESPWHEERLVALLILVWRYARAEPRERDAIYRLYLRRRARVNNWDLVDLSAEHIVGAHLRDGGPRVLAELARSKRLWDRRIAMLATFHYIKRGEYRPTLRIARALLLDEHDLIHKAVGWMLREVGKRDRAVAEAFLRRHAPRMPRTMLRYATERFPAALRSRYLAMR
jgi:3-methyladenine DNA glycosylase AlkD